MEHARGGGVPVVADGTVVIGQEGVVDEVAGDGGGSGRMNLQHLGVVAEDRIHDPVD